MKEPPIPADERHRLHTLRALNVLDTPPEERFDRLTRLARRLFGVPIALVSLVDENRQWFKSKAGLDADETSRDISFCGHAILEDEIFTIPDALDDRRFHDNPLVTEDPNIRFYAGCPLRVPNGSRLGTFCIIDKEPREFSDDEKEMLSDLAAMAEQELLAVQLATMDELTLLSNRRGFMALARHALNVCRRLSKPAALLYFDLDKFKQINDRYGHAEGDRALQTFADLLKSTFRESDVTGRIGGDEFVVFLTGADAQQTEALLGRFQKNLSESNASQARGYDLSSSVGVTAFEPEKHSTLEALMSESDMSMFQEKNARAAPVG